MSTRMLMQEAGVLLEQAASTERPVVKEICLKRADRLLAEAEVLHRTKITSMPKPFMDAIVNQKRGDGTKVIAVCPTLSREDFIKTLPPDHPARIAQEKKEQGQ
jgi:hypothetical protein